MMDMIINEQIISIEISDMVVLSQQLSEFIPTSWIAHPMSSLRDGVLFSEPRRLL